MGMVKIRMGACAPERGTKSEEGHRGTHFPLVLPGLHNCKAATPNFALTNVAMLQLVGAIRFS